ncbi:MAG: 5-formyltetrahydrofolate cyclo-ligase [Synechococcales bacterium]|nr:5-formyltetrahydrofolate cyclo-ligase [Synechococcales bacterium]
MQSDLTKRKAQLRQQLLQQRRSLSTAQWQAQSQQLCTHLQQTPEWQQAQTIGAYFSIHQEPNLSFLWQDPPSPAAPLPTPDLRQSSPPPPLSPSPPPLTPKRFAFPRCIAKQLQWHFWQPHQPRVSGKYGIPEPDPSLPLAQPEQLDLLLVPCVACDRQGYRLGYGGGFYDRLLEDPRWASIPTLGITFQAAIVETLPLEPWDQQLTGILTEQGKLINHDLSVERF